MVGHVRRSRNALRISRYKRKCLAEFVIVGRSQDTPYQILGAKSDNGLAERRQVTFATPPISPDRPLQRIVMPRLKLECGDELPNFRHTRIKNLWVHCEECF
jgi:hypothetical protein